MTDSRWLHELTKTYVAESVGQPANINEELLQEQEEYISILEDVLELVVEELKVDVDTLAEAVAAKRSKSKPLTPAQLKALGMTRVGERAAARGTGGGKSAIATRTKALGTLEKVAGTTQGRALLKKLGEATEEVTEEKAGYKFKGRAGGVEGEHDVEEGDNTVKIGGKTFVKKGSKGSGPRAVKRDGKWEPEGN